MGIKDVLYAMSAIVYLHMKKRMLFVRIPIRMRWSLMLYVLIAEIIAQHHREEKGGDKMKKNKFISVVAILIFVLSLTIAGLWGFLLFKKNEENEY